MSSTEKVDAVAPAGVAAPAGTEDPAGAAAGLAAAKVLPDAGGDAAVKIPDDAAKAAHAPGPGEPGFRPHMNPLAIFVLFLQFGCRAFGGPVAQINLM